MEGKPPLCIVKFIGSVRTETRSARLDAMFQVATLMWAANPCKCEGCTEFLAEAFRRGGAL